MSIAVVQDNHVPIVVSRSKQMSLSKRDRSPARVADASPESIAAIRRDVELERMYRVNKYNGVLLVNQGSQDEQAVFHWIGLVLKDVWTRLLTQPLGIPQGTECIVFVGQCLLSKQSRAVFNVHPASRVLCLTDTVLPSHVPQSCIIRGQSYTEATELFLDEAMPNWRQKASLDWKIYYEAREANYPGLSVEEKASYRKVIFGLDEIRASHTMLTDNWSEELRERAERQCDDEDLEALLGDLREEIRKAEKVVFAGRYARFIRHRVEKSDSGRVTVVPDRSHQREIYNLVLDGEDYGESSTPYHQSGILIFCDQGSSVSLDTARNVSVYSNTHDLSAEPGLLRAEKDVFEFVYKNEAEMRERIRFGEDKSESIELD